MESWLSSDVCRGRSRAGDPEALKQAVRWAEKHRWAEGDERERANKKTCGQTYLELYFLAPDPAKIEKIKAYVDSRIEIVRAGEPPTKGWYYCDTLYVGPPTIWFRTDHEPNC